MTSMIQSLPANGEQSKAARWSGRILSGFVVAFLPLDGAMKLLALPIVTQTMATLGWPATAEMARLLGVLTIAGALLYAVPRTSLLGAILLTAYLGGAVATHARVGSPLLTHTLFGVYLGVAAWAGLYLRNTRLREVLAN
jgi:uncharacterized membrane protein YphA (DoxX/SURF4 family)